MSEFMKDMMDEMVEKMMRTDDAELTSDESEQADGPQIAKDQTSSELPVVESTEQVKDENVEFQAIENFGSQDAVDLFSASSQSEETKPTGEPDQSEEQGDSAEADTSEETVPKLDQEPKTVETSQQNEAPEQETSVYNRTADNT